MKVIIAEKPGGPEVLMLVDIPTPAPAEHELLVRVKAAAINRTDILRRKADSATAQL